MNDEEKNAIEILDYVMLDYEVGEKNLSDNDFKALSTLLNLIDRLQKEIESYKSKNEENLTDEEKQAIEEGKYQLTIKSKSGWCDIGADSLQTLLNLINRLQKENEDWKKAYQEEKDSQFEILINSIPNQVIRDKIKEIEEKTCIESAEFDEWVIDILKELLGE